MTITRPGATKLIDLYKKNTRVEEVKRSIKGKVHEFVSLRIPIKRELLRGILIWGFGVLPVWVLIRIFYFPVNIRQCIWVILATSKEDYLADVMKCKENPSKAFLSYQKTIPLTLSTLNSFSPLITNQYLKHPQVLSHRTLPNPKKTGTSRLLRLRNVKRVKGKQAPHELCSDQTSAHISWIHCLRKFPELRHSEVESTINEIRWI